MLLASLDDEVLGAFDGVCYVIDRRGIILGVGRENWDRFAALAGDTSPMAADVRQRNLFDFIAGGEVGTQLRQVLAMLASGEATDWIMPYRCDSPGVKRNMRLSVRPVREAGGVAGFLFQSVTLDETQRPPLDIFDFANMIKRAREEMIFPLVFMCSYCSRVKDESHTCGQWAPAEEYYARGGTSDVRLSHGVCPDCCRTIFASLRNR